MVLESLDKLIGACEGRKESMVVEGVHLSLNAVIRLMQKHPSIVPFLVHISNEAKHRERFAVRSTVLASLQKALALIKVLSLQASSALILIYISNEVKHWITAILMHLSGTLSMINAALLRPETLLHFTSFKHQHRSPALRLSCCEFSCFRTSRTP